MKKKPDREEFEEIIKISFKIIKKQFADFNRRLSEFEKRKALVERKLSARVKKTDGLSI